MKRFSVISLIFSLLFILSCEDKKDTTPPTVTITSPINGSTISGILTISVESTDDSDIDYVELFLDGESTGMIDNNEPYELLLNTSNYFDGRYTLTVKSQDINENTSLSEELLIRFKNNNSPHEIIWEKYFGGTGNDSNYMGKVSEGKIISVGRSNRIESSSYDGMLLIMDSDGTIISEKYYGDSDVYESFYGLTITKDGELILVGSKNDDGWIVKTDLNGELILEKTYGLERFDFFRDVVENSDGEFLISGGTESYTDSRDGWFIKIDKSGNEIFNRYFGGTGQDRFRGINLSENGDVFLTGWYNSESVEYNGWLVKGDQLTGSMTTLVNLGGDTGTDIFTWSTLLTDGNIIITGGTNSFGNEGGTGWILKFDQSGGELNRGYTDLSTNNWFNSNVVLTPDNGFLVSGEWNPTTTEYVPGSSDTEGLLVKFNSDLQLEYQVDIGGDDFDGFNYMDNSSDGGYILFGESKSSGSGEQDGWIIKISSQKKGLIE